MASITPPPASLGVHEQGNRIFFAETRISNMAVSARDRTDGKIGIKKATFLERLFGKATKLSFDGGHTTTVVNTNSLKKYIVDISRHENLFCHYRACVKGKPKPEHDLVLQKPRSTSVLNKTYSASFGVFKEAALAGASDPAQTASKLGSHLVKYVTGSHQFVNDLNNTEQSEALKEIAYGKGTGYVMGKGSGKQLQRSASEGTYIHVYDWENLHEFITKFPTSEVRKSHFEEEARLRELANRPIQVLTPKERTDVSPGANTLQKAGKCAAAIGIGAVLGGPLGALAGAATYGAATGVYNAVQWLRTEA